MIPSNLCYVPPFVEFLGPFTPLPVFKWGPTTPSFQTKLTPAAYQVNIMEQNADCKVKVHLMLLHLPRNSFHSLPWPPEAGWTETFRDNLHLGLAPYVILNHCASFHPFWIYELIHCIDTVIAWSTPQVFHSSSVPAIIHFVNYIECLFKFMKLLLQYKTCYFFR